MPKRLDLNEQVFGHLKVIQEAPSKNGKTYWVCECLLCGNIKHFQTGNLVSGVSKSCGCQNNKNFNFSEQVLEKECPICNNIFTTNFSNRIYCYNCSPEQKDGAAIYQKTKKRAIKHQLITYKGGKCQICGYDKCEGSLHFHHKNPKEKEFTLSAINLNQSFSMEALYAEVDKCDLLCANCHGEVHYSE